jgi:AraC-like DNA-binding protein
MDPLTDLLPSMRVLSAAYTRLEATSPWGLDFMPYYHTKFGLVLEGTCWIGLRDDTALVEMSAGSCYLLPRGDAFTVRDRADAPTCNFEDVAENIDGRTLRHGGGGDPTTIVGGRFLFDGPHYPPVLDLLPSLVHFKTSATELKALLATVQLLASEVSDPALGSPLIVDRLADIFFVQTLRAYVGSINSREVKWLGAVADVQIGRALRALHEKSGHPWTIESLAAAVNMSRSAFALRFKQLVGEAPMEYLTRCRLLRASRLLRESDLTLALIAGEIGYESEVAFSKAFKRQLGVPPGQYRSTHRRAAAPNRNREVATVVGSGIPDS